MQNQLQHIGIAAGLTTSQPRQLRSACDICHEQKVRCSGRGSRCTRCYKNDLVCHYSYIGRRGKPKGSKNKKTLEKERINAIATLKSSTRYVESQMSHGSGTQTRSLADGLASQGLFSSSPQPSTLPFSPNTLDFNFLDPNLETLDTLEIGASSQGEIILSEAVMLDPIMLDDPSSSFGPQLRSSTKPIPLLSTSSPAESDGGSFEENVPEIFDSPSSSDISSPPLSLRSPSTRHIRPLDSGMAGVSLQKSWRKASPDTKFDCRCLQTYADMLCTLRQAEEVDRFGNFMRITGDAYSTLRENLECSQCLYDTQVLQLCSMALKTLVGAIGAACTTKHSPDIRSGDYVLQQEDSAWVGLRLLIRNISSFKAILDIFKWRLDQSKITGACGLQEQEYLDKVVHSINESMNLMLNHIQTTKNRKK